MHNAFAEATATAQQELCLQIARTPDQILEAKKLRYKVYCEERGYEPGEGGLEQDEFDDNAHHVLVRNRVTGEVYGTVRIVMSKRDQGGLGFPMQRVCEDYVLAPLPAVATAEISRFALTRDRTGISPAAAALMRLYLIQGIVQLSGELGLTHWCAIMEKTLLRLLRSTSIYFLPVGPAIEYHGVRQPAIFTLEDGLERMRREQPQIWSFLTLDGSLWSPEMVAGTTQGGQVAS
ncbi:MAG TPA: GNAT family N-acyltransferase [Acetobacteraceae bacterium]|nr:GNAT family N-acyltransferase [Acetobacteraceae bacterium]